MKSIIHPLPLVLCIVLSFSSELFGQEIPDSTYSTYLEILENHGLDDTARTHLVLQMVKYTGKEKLVSPDNLKSFLVGYEDEDEVDSYVLFQILQWAFFKGHYRDFPEDIEELGATLARLVSEWPYEIYDLLILLEDRNRLETAQIAALDITANYFNTHDYNYEALVDFIYFTERGDFTPQFLFDFMESMEAQNFTGEDIVEFFKYSESTYGKDLGFSTLDSLFIALTEILKAPSGTIFNDINWRILTYQAFAKNSGVSLAEQVTLLEEYQKVFGIEQGKRIYIDVLEMHALHSSNKMNKTWIREIPGISVKITGKTNLSLRDLGKILPAGFLFNSYHNDVIDYMGNEIAHLAETFGVEETRLFLKDFRSCLYRESLENLSKSADKMAEIGIILSDITNAFKNTRGLDSYEKIINCTWFITEKFPHLLSQFSLDQLKEFYLPENGSYNYSDNKISGFPAILSKVEIMESILLSNSVSPELTKIAIRSFGKNNHIISSVEADYPRIIKGIDSMNFLTEEEKSILLSEYFSTYESHSIEDLYAISGILYLGGYSFDDFFRIYFSIPEIELNDRIAMGQHRSNTQESWHILFNYGNRIKELCKLNDKETAHFLEVLWEGEIHGSGVVNNSVLGHGMDTGIKYFTTDIKTFSVDQRRRFLDVFLSLIKNATSFGRVGSRTTALTEVLNVLIEAGYSFDTALELAGAMTGNPRIKSTESVIKDMEDLLETDLESDEIKSIMEMLYGRKTKLYGGYMYEDYRASRKPIINLRRSIELTRATGVELPDGSIRYIFISPSIYGKILDNLGFSTENIDSGIIEWSHDMAIEGFDPLKGLYYISRFPSLLTENPYENLSLANSLSYFGSDARNFKETPEFLVYKDRSELEPEDLLFLFFSGIDDIETLKYLINAAGGLEMLKKWIYKLNEKDIGNKRNYLFSLMRLSDTLSTFEGYTPDQVYATLSEFLSGYSDSRYKVYNAYGIIKIIQGTTGSDFRTAMESYLENWNEYRAADKDNFYSKIHDITKEAVENED